MAALRSKDGAALAPLIHPEKGIRFTPYTRVDPTTDRHFSRDDLAKAWSSPDSLLWGSFDGSGEPIRLSVREYLARFGNDLPSGRPIRTARDSEPMGTGNAINNVRAAYPGATVIEYYNPGVDPKYGGMDWRSVWIVLERSGPDWYVTGVVHGSWTT